MKSSITQSITYIDCSMTRTVQVNVSATQYKFGVVTFDDRAKLKVKLRASNVSEILSRLPFSAGGQRSNLRDGLMVARTQAFSVDNGMRPPAYKAAVVVWDGRRPQREFGTLVDEAPRPVAFA